MDRMTRRLTVLLPTVVVLAACGPFVVAPLESDLDIHVRNGTTLQVHVLVDGAGVAIVGPGGDATIPAASLPRPPWTIDGRTDTGRLLVSLPIVEGSVLRTQNGLRSAGARIDLSCGRLDVYVGGPMLGPAPGPGVPGDCLP